MHERVVMKSVWIILYFLLICTLNQVHYGQNSEGNRLVLSDLDTLKEASSQNNPFAQAVLALAYVHGDKGLNISMENAHKLAKISADSGHWLGLFTLGYLHRFEPLGPNPEEVRLRYLQAFQDPDGQLVKLAARKDPIASYVLGEIFTSDEVRPNIVPDLQLAARHYEISSQGGYQPASVQFALFKLHAIVDEGMGIQRDAAVGINLLEQASRQKLPAAHHYLGRSYFKGDGVGSDLEMALVHFQAAADRGYGLSQLTVADFYAYGVTGPPKIDIALRYARLALNYNETTALEKIAEYQKILSGDSNASLATTSPEPPKVDTISMDDIPEPPSPQNDLVANAPDVPEAIRLPSPYAANSFQNIPNSLSPEIPSTSNYDIANTITPAEEGNLVSNLKEPSLSTDFAGVSSLEICESAKKLYWGRGVQVDYLGAHKFFTESANDGNAEAARYLGIMYLRGKGVEKNLQTSVDWFEKAAKGGDSLAQKNLVTIKSMFKQ
jgi:TPR repeat protein